MIRNVLLLTLALLVTGRMFVFGVVWVETASMVPGIEPGSTWIYSKVSQPGVGDVVAIRDPSEPGLLHVKRLVAVAGDQVELQDGRLYRNGQRNGRDLVAEIEWEDTDCRTLRGRVLEESDGQKTWNVLAGGDHEAFEVKAGGWWALGDNRDNSSDSRHWGTVPENWIVGVLIQRIWSHDRCSA